METFLQELAKQVIGDGSTLDQMTFIFPNRRAALYFEQHLARALQRPRWAPHLYSVEEFFRKESKLLEDDRLHLIYTLHQVYNEVLQRKEAFDRFYFWGDMLLKDFDEIDKYMVQASHLFRDLSKLKELDDLFDYLTDEHKAFLKNFWEHFSEQNSPAKDAFLALWQKLPKVYSEYTKRLRTEGVGYEGMIHREVAERFQKKKPEDYSTYVWAGFNALTKAEAMVMQKMVEGGARVFWDADAYYMDDAMQEAGTFLRRYRDFTSLKSTFTTPPANIKGAEKNIVLTGVPRKIGQAKLAGELVADILSQIPEEERPVTLSRTVIVLPDESMLLPVLHSLPADLKDINVTMGFPLAETPLYHLLDLVVEMQLRKRKAKLNHREVSSILAHPYTVLRAGFEADNIRRHIIAKNRIFVSIDDIRSEHEFFGILFQDVEPTQATRYLLDIVRYLGATFLPAHWFDKEYAYHFYQHLAGLDAILKDSATVDWRGYQKLFRQVTQSQRIPFSGEPLRGLQIMGVLETRNLDFDNVIFLSLNEGQMPASAGAGSYVPFAVKKAYGLPTHEHRDAIYAYLFYRLLQRSKNVHLFYNTEADVIGNGEVSRFVQQLLLESNLAIRQQVLHNPIQIQEPQPIIIQKSDVVMQQLNRFVPSANPEAKRLSPTTLNDYIECTLRFYLKHVVRLTEADTVEEDVDARMYGNIVHDAIYWFYDDLRKKRGGLVQPDDLVDQEATLRQLIDRAFRKNYKLEEGEQMDYEGNRIIVRESAAAFLLGILSRDLQHAPFEVLMLEEDFEHPFKTASGEEVMIGGKIDRADLKDGVVRLIDYKTGRDDSSFVDVASLFVQDSKRNKAAFQTIHYAYAFQLKHPVNTYKLLPGLYNRGSLFEEGNFGLTFKKGSKVMDDAKPLLGEFADRLHAVINDIYNPDIPFVQTSETSFCTYCLYKSMCRR